MMEDGDAALVTRALEGNQDAFRVLVERHSVRLFQLAFRMTGNEQDAEDIVQETFLRACKRLERFESRANFGTWLHRIAVNCSLDLLRKRQRQEQRKEERDPALVAEIDSVPSGTPTPDHQVFNAEVQLRIASALDLLTPMERAAFVMRHFEERSIAEIGKVLELGDSAAKQAIFRAVQKMRRALEPIVSATE
jgi:RNA polymerase sigma-70 factor, ECF subfamily